MAALASLLLSLLPALLLAEEGPEACTGLSTRICYRGSWAATEQGGRYASYQGVRYAQPPVGPLRFLPPVVYKPDKAVYNVSAEATVSCPQLNWFDSTLEGQEDCLLLNVYTPVGGSPNSSLPATPLPVMVWVHGGGLTVGSDRYREYGPQNFMDRDVVVVTINYRLGPFGFLYLGTEQVPGNAGLRDQALALAWVRVNIASFGGDPNMVTLFGESAGSSSVSYHLLSPVSKGLFHRAVMQSGTSLGKSWGRPLTTEHALQYAEMLGSGLGCSGCDDGACLDCLQAQPMADIMANATLFGGGTVWQAVPDFSVVDDPFLPGDPEDLLFNGDFHTEVDVIIGTNQHEGTISMLGLLLDPTNYDAMAENWDTYGAPGVLGIVDPAELTPEDVGKTHDLLDYYIGGIENFNADHLYGLLDMYTDAGFLWGTQRTLRLLTKHGVNTHTYLLTHQGQYSFTQLWGIEDPVGVSHADDLIYLWSPFFGVEEALTGEDALVRDLMTTAWTDFARYGDPSPPGSSLSWEAVIQGEEHRFLNISGPTPAMGSSRSMQERMDLWDSLFGH